jgi:enoyl-CoA hydratase/carnithine racemase
MSSREAADLLRSPYADDVIAEGVDAVVVPAEATGLPTPGALPIVLIGVGDQADGSGAFDLVVPKARLEAVLAAIEANPIASTSLAVLLRATATLSVENGLAAESAVYSLLQSGAEFARWRASTARTAPPPDDGPVVLADNDGDELRIVLNRPHRHNAFSQSMRDELTAVLALAVIDDSIRTIVVTGNGPSFCSGGDLGEFGSFRDPASAHVTRLTRSPARLMHRIGARTHVHLHGACMGAGIELAAFASRVTAHPDASIALPEVALGLVPGAGGTVSVTRRVGRQRCLELALAGPITAAAALEWGLVDELTDSSAPVRT